MRAGRVSSITAAALLLALPGASLGQDENVEALRPGDRLRLTLTEGREVVGTLVDYDSGQVVLEVSPSRRAPYGLDAIQQLERSVGSYREGDVWLGTGIGALAGAAVGVLVWQLANGISTEPGGGVNGGVSIAIGTGLGAVAGAIVGSGPKREEWQKVPLDRLRIGFGSTGAGTWRLVAWFPL